MCTAKIKGGFGVRRLDILSSALLGTRSWHFVEERGALWHCVIKSKYEDEEGGWSTYEVGGVYGVCVEIH